MANQIHGAYPYEVQTLPLDLPNVPARVLDPGQFSAWKSETATNKQDEKILDLVGSKVQRVPYDTFANSVASCVANFKRTGLEKYVAFVEPGKSQTWVTGIAVNRGLEPDMYLRIGEEGANMLESTLATLGKENFPTVGTTSSETL